MSPFAEALAFGSRLIGRGLTLLSGVKSLVFAVLIAQLLAFTAQSAVAETLSVPFSRGFIGTVGTSTGKANNIVTFSTLGVVRAYFIQESNSSQFGGTQGNDYSGTVRLVLSSGEVIDIAGAVNWRDTNGSTLNAIGFIPAPTASATISYGSGSTYTISASSNFGLQANTSVITYSDGTNISGNAATSGLLGALNDYLAVAIASAPAGPVTVVSQSTTDQTPVVTGTVTLAAGETLTVVVNGKQYSGSGITIDTNNNTWSLTVPDANALPYAVYDVTATIIGSAGYTLVDSTSQELTIFAMPRFVDGTDATVTSYTESYYEQSSSTVVLATVRALDADSPSLTYSIVTNVLDGASAPIYAINSSGQITLTTAGVSSFANDYETNPNTHTLTVRASDGTNTVDATVQLTELDVDEAATIRLVKTVDTTSTVGSYARVQSGTVVDVDGDGRVSVGDRIYYDFTVINTGTTTVSNITLADADADWTSTASIASLAGGTTDRTTFAAAAYIILTQADIDAGTISNSATATGDSPSGTDNVTDVSGTDPEADTDDATETLLAAAPGLHLVKTGTLVDSDGTPGVSAGDRIDYAFTVTNTGTVTLTNVTVNDPLLGGELAGRIATLSPGQSDQTTFFGSYLVTSDDVLRGNVPNQAIATGDLLGGGQSSDLSGTTDANDDVTMTFLGSIGGTVKRSDGTLRSGSMVRLIDTSTGQTVATLTTDEAGRYSFIGLPTGTYCVEFEVPEGSGLRATDGDGEGNWSGDQVCGMHVEEGSGRIFDEVDAVFVDPSGIVYDSVTRQPLAGATVRLFHNGTEVTDTSWYAPGSDRSGVVTDGDGVYSFLLQSPAQSGTYSLQVSKDGFAASQLIPPQSGAFNPGIGLGVVEIVPSAAPPQTGDAATYYTSFRFEFSDWTHAETLSKGVVHNHIPLDPTGLSADLRVTKTADTSGLHQPARIGDVIRYTITAENFGNTALLSVNLDDPKTADEALVQVAGVSDDGKLDPGETWTWTASITLEAGNVNAGSLENLATLTGEDVLRTPVLIESAPGNGNAVPGAGNGTPTVVQLGGLIAEIEDELSDILEDDLRVTIERLAQTGSGFAKEALARLKAGEPESCGDQPDKGGSLSATANDQQIVIEGSNERIVYDCAKREWRIDSFEGSLRSLDGFGDQAMFTYTHRRERLVGENSLRGRFIGVYASKSDVKAAADGTITGLGLFGGLYGAKKITGDLFLDYYLGAATGRHSFTLDFPREITIRAKGNYTYWALFGGAALSGEFHIADTRVIPRAGIDLAYAPGADVKVTATQAGRVESGGFKLDSVGSGRFFIELGFENDLAMAGDGQGRWDKLDGQFTFAPNIFCDIQTGSAAACGFGFDFGYTWSEDDGATQSSVKVEAEQSSNSRYLALTFDRIRRFDTLNGELRYGVSLSSKGEPTANIAYKAEF